jgi:hypothetical protein
MMPAAVDPDMLDPSRAGRCVTEDMTPAHWWTDQWDRSARYVLISLLVRGPHRVSCGLRGAARERGNGMPELPRRTVCPAVRHLNFADEEADMTWQRVLGRICVASLVLSSGAGITAQQAAADQAKAAKNEAAAAVKASPELVNALSKEIGGTPEQAAGAAGALFGVAKSRLKADEFAQVAKAVPGMNALLAAAPGAGAASGGLAGAAAQVAGTAGSAAGGLANATSAFSKLGLKPDLVGKAVPVLTSFVTKSGGADVGKLLAGALK